MCVCPIIKVPNCVTALENLIDPWERCTFTFLLTDKAQVYGQLFLSGTFLYLLRLTGPDNVSSHDYYFVPANESIP